MPENAPRPWRMHTSHGDTWILDANGEEIAYIPDVSIEDAGLMAAAPELLEAAQATVKAFNKMSTSSFPGDPLYNLAKNLLNTQELINLTRAIDKGLLGRKI